MPNALPKALEQLEKRRYVGLLAALVLVLFVYPYVGDGFGGTLLTALVAAIPAMATLALVDNKKVLLVGALLGIPAIVAILVDDVGRPYAASGLGQAIPLAFYAYATGVICFDVVSRQNVMRDALMGAVSGYLMLGYTWGVAYMTLHSIDPDSFHFTHGVSGASDASEKLFFFSFVTLSTLGYGDIVPLTAKARSLAMLEALAGVLFLAVVVARLVGTYGRESEANS
jgi:hypothetical protein